MSLPSRDLAVAYRVYPRVSSVPLIHATDKYALVETCLRSFQRALGSLSVKIWVILDGCPPEYELLFRKYFPAEDLSVVALPGVGNQATFDAQITLLVDQTESDLVYFAEDDYFYLPGQLETLVNFLRKTQEADFVTPYDHPDYDRLRLHHPGPPRAFGGRDWRRVSTTCLTFLTSREALRKTQTVFRTYRHRRNLDASLWLSLTKTDVFRVGRILRLFFEERASFKIILKAWIYNGGPILFGRRRTLWAPVPSLATHLDRDGLAPRIDWQEEIQRQESAHADRH